MKTASLIVAWLVLVGSIFVMGVQIERLIAETKAEVVVTERAVAEVQDIACGTWQSLFYVVENQKTIAPKKWQRDNIQFYIERFAADFRARCPDYVQSFPEDDQ